MSGRLIQSASSAYAFPLLIKQIWNTALLQSRDQEVVYRDKRRLTYAELRERVGRLASALASVGVEPGDTVGVMEWDSHRFLEAFFAIPMMGAIMQTVNVRLSQRADLLHDRPRRRSDVAGQRRIRPAPQRAEAEPAGRQAAHRDVGPFVTRYGRSALCRRVRGPAGGRLRLTTTFRTSTRIRRRRPSTRRARRGCRRAFSTAIASSSFMR